MGQKSVQHAAGSYAGFGPIPVTNGAGGVSSVLHGLTGSGILDGNWGNVKKAGSLVGVLNALRGSDSIETPYWQDPWIFASIYRIAEAGSSARIRFHRDRSPDAELVDETDPIYEVFRRPSRALTYTRFLRHMFTLWWIYGEFPLAFRYGSGTDWITEPGRLRLDESTLTGPKRLELWPVKPDVAELMYGEDLQPDKWRVNVAGLDRYVDIPAEAVAHMYAPDPMDVMMTRGMGRLEAALRTCEIDWQAERYEEANVRTAGVPNIVVAAKSNMTEEQAKAIKSDLYRQHQRPEKQGGAMVLRGKDYEVLFPGHKPREMAFQELRAMNRETKVAVMGANPAWLGIIVDANRATSEEGRKNAWEDTIVPALDTFADEIQNEVMPHFPAPWSEYAVSFDTSHIQALRADADKSATRAKLFFETFPVTMREAFDLAEMELPEDIEGTEATKQDMARESAEMQAELAPDPPPAAAGQPPPAKQALSFEKDDFDEGRAATWRVFHDQTMEHEARIKKRVMRVFSGYIDKSIALARDLAQEGKSFAWDGAKAHAIDENELHLLLPDLIPWEERLAGAVSPAFAELLEAQARYMADSLGAERLVTRADPHALKFLADKEVRIKETLGTLRDAIKSTLEQALTDSDAIGTLPDRIRQVLEMYRSDLKVLQDSLGTRAELIARTETTSTANGARYMEAQAHGITEMRWISSRDAQVRESHAELDGRVAGMGETFGYGLRFPGDPEAEAGQVVNCRCSIAPTARGAQAVAGEAA